MEEFEYKIISVDSKETDKPDSLLADSCYFRSFLYNSNIGNSKKEG